VKRTAQLVGTTHTALLATAEASSPGACTATSQAFNSNKDDNTDSTGRRMRRP
jgi:hypothetical protein